MLLRAAAQSKMRARAVNHPGILGGLGGARSLDQANTVGKSLFLKELVICRRHLDQPALIRQSHGATWYWAFRPVLNGPPYVELFPSVPSISASALPPLLHGSAVPPFLPQSPRLSLHARALRPEVLTRPFPLRPFV